MIQEIYPKVVCKKLIRAILKQNFVNILGGWIKVKSPETLGPIIVVSDPGCLEDLRHIHLFKNGSWQFN